MRVVGCTLALILVVGIVGGCGNTDGEAEALTTGKVAVIDLDLVAKLLGRDVEMANAVKQREGSLNQTLARYRDDLRSKLEAEQGKLGDSPTPEATKSLQAFGQEVSVQYNQAMQNAKTNLTQHRAQVIHQFREQVRPIAQQAAKDNGLSIVVTKNDSVVFAYESAVDITDDVVQRMRSLPSPVQPATHTASQPATSQQR